jgi:N-acetylglucosamine malate deacetylase 1
MNKSILVVAAHPDDEALGCGGAIALHAQTGADVQVVFMTDGVNSRDKVKKFEVEERRSAAREASKILGAQTPIFLSFPDNQMDTVSLLEIIKPLEKIIDQHQPQIVYTHHSGDLNIDHKITHQAVMTACRPQPNSTVREIYSFEVLSSTEWSLESENIFKANCFLDINSVKGKKIASINAYKNEMREFPHSRSIKSVEALITLRGSSVGLANAEGFMLKRMIRSIV